MSRTEKHARGWVSSLAGVQPYRHCVYVGKLRTAVQVGAEPDAEERTTPLIRSVIPATEESSQRLAIRVQVAPTEDTEPVRPRAIVPTDKASQLATFTDILAIEIAQPTRPSTALAACTVT